MEHGIRWWFIWENICFNILNALNILEVLCTFVMEPNLITCKKLVPKFLGMLLRAFLLLLSGLHAFRIKVCN